ncbi:MAG: hypothetical protein ACM3X6_02990 [Patescibacteria group bacterium]
MAATAITTEKPADVTALQKQIEQFRRQDIALLGDGEVFVRRLPNGGQIKAVKGALVLRETNGEIAEIQGKFMTTAKGFNTLNQIAGLSIITPATLVLPSGETVVNPYPLQDPESGSIAKVWVRKLAIGYGPTGNLVVTSATLLYDIKMYFIQDILKKVKGAKDAGRVCHENQLTEDEKNSRLFLRIDGHMGVWANYSHPEILKALDTFVNKKLFAERNAQSICERLVMAKHPALAHAAYLEVTGRDKAHVSRVAVIGYMNDLTREQMLEITNRAEQGEEIAIGGQKAEVIETVGAATTEEMEIEKDPEELASDPHPHNEQDTGNPPVEQSSRRTLFDTGGERL